MVEIDLMVRSMGPVSEIEMVREPMLVVNSKTSPASPHVGQAGEHSQHHKLKMLETLFLIQLFH